MVQEEPKTIDEFKELIEKRLKIKDLPILSTSDQEELVIKIHIVLENITRKSKLIIKFQINICVQEARFKWKEMKRMIEDPFLVNTIRLLDELRFFDILDYIFIETK
jgi:hypothetical protein